MSPVDCNCGPDWRKPKPNGTCATCGGWLPGESPPSLTAMWRGTAQTDDDRARLEADLAALREAAQAVVDHGDSIATALAPIARDESDQIMRELIADWDERAAALRAVLASADSEDPTTDLPADLLRVLRDPNIVIAKDREIMLDGKPLLDHIREWRNAPSNTASADSESRETP